MKKVQTARFRAMNTDIEVQLYCDAGEFADYAALTRNWFRDTEARFSRFRPDSELMRLNRSAGRPFLVSDMMFDVLAAAERYRQVTDGIFNVHVLEALRNAGYDASFETLAERARPLAAGEAWPPGMVAASLPGVPALALDRGMKAAALAPGAAIDLGGIAKSWAVSRIAGWLRRRRGIAAGLVNAGGDLAVWNDAPELAPARIAIEDPRRMDGRPAGSLVLSGGAAATSGTLGRRWTAPIGDMHHLIDPATMQPGRSGVVQCTVTGPDATACEVWAKVLCIAGEIRGGELLRRRGAGCEALFFREDGTTGFIGGSEPEARWRDMALGAPGRLRSEGSEAG